MNKVVVLLLAILMLMLVQSNSISNGVDARLLEGKNKKEVKTVDKNVVNKEDTKKEATKAEEEDEDEDEDEEDEEEGESNEDEETYGENVMPVGNNKPKKNTTMYETEYEGAAEYEEIYPELRACKASNEQVLYDEWSGGKNPNCTFPFLFRGKLYYECTNVEYLGKYWCANSCDYREGNFMRGVCVNQKDAARGILGTGFQMTATNIFFGTLIGVAILLSLVLGCMKISESKSSSSSSSYSSVSNRVVDSFENGSGLEIPGFEMSKKQPIRN